MRRDEPVARHLTHSEDCRRRVEEALAEDWDFQSRINRAIDRKGKYEEASRTAQEGASSSSGQQDEHRVREGGPSAIGHQEEPQGRKRGRDEEGYGDEERRTRPEMADDLDIPIMDETGTGGSVESAQMASGGEAQPRALPIARAPAPL